MKLIVRADDVGYTDVCNIGAFETIYNGVTTAADLMLDTPGAIDAMKRLKELPWISVGWHSHFWGSPVLDPSEVPSLYDASTGHFRRDINRAEDVDYDECIKEMRAQMERCIKYLGRVPDTGGMAFGNSPFSRAIMDICEEYGILSGFAWSRPFPFTAENREFREPKNCADKKIYMMPSTIPGGHAENTIRADSLQETIKYDPLEDFISGAVFEGIPEDAAAVFVLHPGYVDHYVLCEGDHGIGAIHYLLLRPADQYALCSDRIKQFIIEKKLELCSFTDAAYGTRKYQNHLRSIGSPLAM